MNFFCDFSPPHSGPNPMSQPGSTWEDALGVPWAAGSISSNVGG